MKWYLGAVILLGVAIVLQMGLVAYAMYVLLALMVVSRMMARVWINNLIVERECSRQEASVGESVAVIVTLHNRGRLPIAWVLAEDLVPRQALLQRPPKLRLSGRRTMIALLGPGASRRLLYQMHFEMRGYYQLGPVMLETGDLFGLHRRFRVAAEPTYVLVRPRVVALSGYQIASRRPIGEIRMTHRLYEDPTRISGIRAYQRGDSLSRIHWRATARTGALHSKTYEPSSIAGATLLLDFHLDSFHPRHEPLRSELAITTCASLAGAIYEMGEQVGLATNARDAADRIRTEGWASEAPTRDAARQSASMRTSNERLKPLVVQTRRGPEQFSRILDTLARAELTDGLTFAQLVGELQGRLPRDATVIAVVSQATPEVLFVLGNLRRQGYRVLAMVLELDDYNYGMAAGRLLAEGIEARQVKDEASLAEVCAMQTV